MKTTLALFTALLALAGPAVALAQMDHRHGHSDAAPSAEAASEGTVKKIDKATARITIAHGPLANLGMPAMTMAFRVKDAAMLDAVKPGDKVRFTAASVDGALTVMALATLK